MSRFFAGAVSDSESDSGGSGSDGVVGPSAVAAPTRFEFESSDSEEETRVVRSEKDKRYDAMVETIKKIRNQLKINDWTSVSQSFDRLNKQLHQARNITKKEGIPKFYWRICCHLQTEVEAAFQAMKAEKAKKKNKKLNATNVRALGQMKQRMKKHKVAHAEAYEAYEKDPMLSEEEEEAVSDDEDKQSGSDDPEDDGDESASSVDWDDDDSDSGSDLDMGEITRDYWVKKTQDSDSEDPEEAKEKRRKRQEERAAKRAADKKAAGESKRKGEKKAVEYTPEVIAKRLQEILAKFGKKTTNRKSIIEDLTLLSQKATAPGVMLKVRVTLIAALFDQRAMADFMAVDTWQLCFNELERLIEFLMDNPSVRLTEDENVEESFGGEEGDPQDPMELQEQKQKQTEEVKEKTVQETEPGTQRVTGNMYSFLARLYSELWKSLKFMDPHTPEYIARLQDESKLKSLLESADGYYEAIHKLDFRARVALLRLELEYYRYDAKFDSLSAEALAESAQRKQRAKQSVFGCHVAETKDKDDTASSLVAQLASFVYEHGESRPRTRALLCHVFWLALHNRWTAARDLLLMSHLQDAIAGADVATRILFNRATAQMGLCAFRIGDHRQALYCLQDFYQTNRIKELLAQGTTQSWRDKDLERERLEKRRMYPYHMHMNLDMLEAVHLVSAMLQEVINMALHGTQNRRRIISRQFRKHYDQLMRQAFTGPPESTREIIMAATRALMVGDWKSCWSHLDRLRCWAILPQPDEIKSRLQRQVQEVSVKSYLLAFGAQYTSITMDSLRERFELPRDALHRIASTMMINEQLQGAWDQPHSAIVMHSLEPTRLQKAALKYSDKVNLFLEQNERLLELRGGYYAGGGRDGGGDGGGKGGHRTGGGGRGGRTGTRNGGWDRFRR